MAIRFDSSEVRTLAIDLSDAPGRIQSRAPRVIRRNVRELARAMKRDAGGHRYLPHFAAAIGTTKLDSIGLSYEVGFDKGGQGSLANIIVFGSINNAPVYDFDAPLRVQTPRLINDLGGAAEGSVLGTGKEESA